MTYNYCNLPEYPCKEDMWDRLKKEKRPIVVYGMGNGADKLFRRLEKYGVEVKDVFASDGFVRGHSYRGYRVKSFSEIKNTYDDFVILLSFASNREEVIELFLKIDEEYEMYIPDMPVADETEYFDREFYNLHYAEILEAYNALADEKSREIYSSLIRYRISGKLKELLSVYTEKDETYSLIGNNIEYMLDLGAYNGDTAKEAISYFKRLQKIYAVEPDRRNFKKLSELAKMAPVEIEAYCAAAWDKVSDGSFFYSGNRNSSINSTASYEHKTSEVALISVDSINTEKIDYIKYDVEGAEFEALVGSHKTIERDKPVLLVSAYHRSRDIFYLTNYLNKMYNGYDIYLRRVKCVPAWEINLILKGKKRT